MDKSYKLPVIVWLRITDYMLGWVQYELGGALQVKDKKVVCVQHLDGAREILMMETVYETIPHKPVGLSVSSIGRYALDSGILFDPEGIKERFNITPDDLNLFVPIECPKMCLTKNGVLRPWTKDVNMGKHQAAAMQNLLRREFWQAVGEFSKKYAESRKGEKYAQVEMIEDFCATTHTPDLYVAAMRREWQRRVKRAGCRP